jgi:cytochrome P450
VTTDLHALFDPQTYLDGVPYEAIDRLRAGGPVVWVPEPAVLGWPEGPGYWAVLGYDEVSHVLRSAELFSSHLGATQIRDPATAADLRFAQAMMLNQDPPNHTRLRGLLSSAFRGRALARLDDAIDRRASELVAAVRPRGQCDLVTDVVADLPVAVLAGVLGVPEPDRGLLYDWANRVIGYQDPDYAASTAFDPTGGTDLARAALQHRPSPGPDARMPDPRTRAGLADLYAYAHGLAERKRADPGDDVMSLLLAEEWEGTHLTTEEFETLFFLFAVAGNETVRNSLPNAVLALIEHPDQYRRLLAEPDLLPAAVEEALRFAPPVMHFRRTAAEPTQLGGQWIERGDKVVVYHVAANRDPAHFDNPHAFTIDRSPNDHLSFGYGPHFCIGARLARKQMRAVIGETCRQLGRLELAGEPQRLLSNFQCGLKTLPVRWPAAR